MTVELYETGKEALPTAGRTPAYASFTSMVTLLDNLRENGLPARFDRSYFGTASGGLVAQTRGTLRFLDLIDSEYRPTDELRALVEADEEERKAILRQLAQERYIDELKLAEHGGTRGQLLALFKERGLGGATAEKAVTFLVHLCEHVGLPTSPYFAKGRAGSTGGTTTRKTSRNRRRGTISTDLVESVSTPPPADTLDSKRSAYIDLLMKLVADHSEGDLPPAELLDRIERALGYEERGSTSLP